MKIRRIIALSVLLLSAVMSFAQEGGVEVDYSRPVKYKVGGVSVEGNNYFSESQIISLTGLQKGMDITVPSDELSGIVRRLWLQRYFEDVSTEAPRIIRSQNSSSVNKLIRTMADVCEALFLPCIQWTHHKHSCPFVSIRG